LETKERKGRIAISRPAVRRLEAERGLVELDRLRDIVDVNDRERLAKGGHVSGPTNETWFRIVARLTTALAPAPALRGLPARRRPGCAVRRFARSPPRSRRPVADRA